MKLRSLLVLVSLMAGAACAQQQQPPATPPSAPLPATQPTTNPADAVAVAAVKDALVAYNKAVSAGDASGIESLMVLKSDTQKKMVETAKGLVTASHDLYTATVEKFGKETIEKAGVTREQFPSAFPELPVDQAKVKVEGEKASIRFGPDESGPAMLTLVKSGDAWKLSGDELLGNMTDQQIKEQSTIIAAVVATMNKVTGDVKAGKIEAADEVVVLFTHRVQKAVNEVRMKQMQDAGPMMPPEMMGPPPTTVPAAPELP